MKHQKCYFCGFTAGWFTTDIQTGELMCIECLNRINSVKQEKKAVPQNRWILREKGGEPIPEADTIGVQSRPVGSTSPKEIYLNGNQLKIKFNG